jgi:hypothetical protein
VAQAHSPAFPSRNFVWLWVGIVLIAMSLLPLGGYSKARDVVAEIKSQAPATARIVTAEQRNGGRYGGLHTNTTLEFQRQTRAGPEQCKVFKKLEGWSNDFLPGKSITVVPRSRYCYDPIVPGQDHANPNGNLVFFLIVLATGTASMLVWLFRWRRERRLAGT